MRILHTSDWHLGRSFHKVPLLNDQEAALVHLADVVRDEAVDVVLVAGDVYDRALPPVEAVTLLDDALERFRRAGAQVILSSGNHDSATRLGFGSRLLAAAGVHVRTSPARATQPVVVGDEHSDSHGPVHFYPLPYLEPAVAAGPLGLEGGGTPSHEAVLGAALDAVRDDLAGKGNPRSVVSAHAFVTGAAACDSERDITVGGVDSVSASTFEGIDYAALGHLHGRQRVTDSVRYSGSLLAYSFSEHAHSKGAWLVELGAERVTSIEEVAIPTRRRLALLRGELEGLLHDTTLTAHEAAWCQITLTDAARPADAMRRLRTRFPHTVELRFEPSGETPEASTYSAKVAGRSDLDLCCSFLEHVRHRPADPGEREEFRQALEALRRREVEEAGIVDLGSVRSGGRGVIAASSSSTAVAG